MAQINAKKEVTLEIDALSYGPYGIGHLEGKAIMIPGTAPGDSVVAQVLEAKDRYAIGRTVRLLRSSGLRQDAPCPYAGDCGGCSWQHLTYQAQLDAKEQSVRDALRRIGKLDNFEVRPIIPSPKPYHYRRRVRLRRAANALGFYRAATRELVAIERCLIADDRINAAIEPLRAWIGSSRTPIDTIEVVTGDSAGDLVAVAETAGRFDPGDGALCAALLRGSPIRGLILRGRGWRRSWGETTIRLDVEAGTCLALDADVFTQVNPEGNRIILRELLDQGRFAGSDRVLELYCGAGNFTLALAKRAGAIVAVEGHRGSIDSAKRNARLNSIENVTWICAPVPEAVARLKRTEKFSHIVLDPPRAGAKGIAGGLAALQAERILYVSCNPATLARDLAGLSQYGYRLETVQPIDLFPQTFHVEAIAALRR